jgi:hypothetical protein
MQLFPRHLNHLPLVVGVALLLLGGGVTFGVWYYFSPWHTQVGYRPEQPVHYSHRLHVGQLGIDCRYCHVGVEVGAKATIPPTQTCMGCHAHVRKDSAKLQALVQSWESGMPVEWVRVHKLPDHAFFDHSAHVSAGVGCVECHGRVDQQEVVQLEKPLSMSWCLDCHRDPGGRLRPPSEVTNMEWEPDESWVADATTVNPPQQCSGCHR